MKKYLYQLSLILLANMSVIGLYAQNNYYMIPDIGTPGMNTYVEFIGPYNTDNFFGVDGLYLNNHNDTYRVKCVNDEDTSKIVISPFIVSWKGKMISTQIFVNPDFQAESDDWEAVSNNSTIPIQVVVDGSVKAIDTLYIVKPFSFGQKNNPDALIGSGGTWGKRSRRGAMIVNEMILNGTGVYEFSTQDCNPNTTYNEGYLPVVLLCKDKFEMGPSAILSVSANGIDGGPGGGGGGHGEWNPPDISQYLYLHNGHGFTVGGGDVDDPTAEIDTINKSSLNGTQSGLKPGDDAGGGGGTGFPFSTGGNGGASTNQPLCTKAQDSVSGGCGGSDSPCRGGGGGGFYSEGACSGGCDSSDNGGNAVGNEYIIPLAGGSGGAGGNGRRGNISGNGGGGGGSISVFANLLVVNSFKAIGAKGEADVYKDNYDSDACASSGGGGAGGGIVISSKLSSTVNEIDVSGGAGGAGVKPGGAGGAGRVRVDGPIERIGNNSPADVSNYYGPSIDTTRYIYINDFIRGTGNGNEIDLYLKKQGQDWFLYKTISGYLNGKWTCQLTGLETDQKYCLVAAQKVPNAKKNEAYKMEPDWVLSQSAANTLFVQKKDTNRDRIHFEWNGHCYAAVLVPEGINWEDAKSEAEATAKGGHLVTLTTEQENQAVYDNLIAIDDRFWIRGFAGPWIGGCQKAGAAEPGGGWKWVNNDGDVSSAGWTSGGWLPGEPNDGDIGMNENRMNFQGSAPGIKSPTWNDLPGEYLMNGYIMEIDSPCRPVIDSESSFDLGQLICDNERCDSIWIKNDGFETLILDEATLQGADADDFEVHAPALPINIENGDSVGIEICFNSTVAGDKTARLVIGNNSEENPYFIDLIAIKDTVDFKFFKLSGDTLDFTDKCLCPGEMKDSLFLIENLSTIDIELNLKIEGNFALLENGREVSDRTVFLTENGFDTIDFRFLGMPEEGEYVGLVIIEDPCGRKDTVFLKACVAYPDLEISEVADTTICPGVAITRYVEIKNKGGFMESVSLSENEVNDLFSVGYPNSDIDPGETIVVDVTFAGSDIDDEYVDTLKIIDDCGVEHQRIIRISVESPYLTIEAPPDTALYCLNESVLRSLKISNNNSVLRHVEIECDNDLFGLDPEEADIESGDTIEVNIDFSGADADGDYTATITIIDDCGGTRQIDVSISFNRCPLTLEIDDNMPDTTRVSNSFTLKIKTDDECIQYLDESDKISFEIESETTALDLDPTYTSSYSKATFEELEFNKFRIELTNFSKSEGTVLAEIRFNTLAGSTLYPKINLSEVDSDEDCIIAQGEDSVVVPLSKFGCTIDTLIVEPYSLANVSIAPNPAENEILAKIEMIRDSYVSLIIYSQIGDQRQVFASRLKKGEHSIPIDVSKLPSGLYYIYVSSGSESFVVKASIIR